MAPPKPTAQPLARVTNPDALDAATGPRAQLAVEAPRGWLVAGTELEVVAPKRLACQRCEGGGCDSCGRAGVWRLPDDEQTRTLRLTLPPHDGDGVQARLVNPFAGSDIEQLLLTVRPASAPSKCVRRIPQTQLAPSVQPNPAKAVMVGIAAFLAAAAAIAAMLL